jgi:co-chaperonin GroES (HSP10)
MRLRPLRDRIVVKPVPRVKSTILEVIMSEKDNMGTVVAVGPQAENKIQPGSFIRFGTMGDQEYLSYQEYFEGDDRYLIMSWKDVCFVEESHAA